MHDLEHLRYELPFLRRFGRALVGEQRLPDIAAVQLMGAFLDGKAQIGAAPLPRVTLYAEYRKVLITAAQLEGSPLVQTLTSMPRQAHWLSVVENLSDAAVAEVLGVTLPDIPELLAAYEREAARQPSTTVLIIEDETLIAHDLRRIVTAMQHTITGVARTRDAAVRLYARDTPALILSDLMLADGSNGIDAIAAIHETAPVPVVYITAYPERLLTGDVPEPPFLISKPFTPKVVRATINQALYLAPQPKQTAPAVRQMVTPAFSPLGRQP
jgi:CheY-like chemotaxis protein